MIACKAAKAEERGERLERHRQLRNAMVLVERVRTMEAAAAVVVGGDRQDNPVVFSRSTLPSSLTFSPVNDCALHALQISASSPIRDRSKDTYTPFNTVNRKQRT